MWSHVRLSLYDYFAIGFFILMFYGLSSKSMFIIIPCFVVSLFSSRSADKSSLLFYLIFSVIAAIGISLGNCGFLQFDLFWRQTISIVTIVFYTAHYRNEVENGKWYWVSTIVFVVIIVFTIWSLFLNVLFPGAFSLREEAVSQIGSLEQNLIFSSYLFVHAVPVVLPIIVFIAKNEHGYKRHCLFLIVGLILYFLLHNSITTSFFLASISVIMSLFLSSENSARNRALYTVGVLLVFWFIIGSATGIMDFLSNISGSNTFSTKMEDIQDYRQTGESSEMGGRVYRLKCSFDVFVKHPIMGSFDSSQLGGHNFIVDYLAFYGIIFSLPLFIFLGKQINISKSGIHPDLLPYYYISLIPFLGLAFLKGQGVVYNHTMIMILFFVLPGMFEKLSDNLYEQDNPVNQ